MLRDEILNFSLDRRQCLLRTRSEPQRQQNLDLYVSVKTRRTSYIRLNAGTLAASNMYCFFLHAIQT